MQHEGKEKEKELKKNIVGLKFTSDWAVNNYALFSKLLSDRTDKETHALEIGSHEGMSAAWFLSTCLSHPKSTITCVDPWEDEKILQTFRENISLLKAETKVKEIRSKSDEVRLDERKWDFVYIDGWHSAASALLDAARSWNSLKNGGIMIWDDYLWKVGEKDWVDRPQMGVNFFVSALSKDLEVVHKGYQFAVRKKIGGRAVMTKWKT